MEENNMKLSKIKDVRVGQIWTFNNRETYDIVLSVRNIDDNLEKGLYEVWYEIFGDFDVICKDMRKREQNELIDIEYCRKGELASDYMLKMFQKPEKYLVGFLGITHKKENGKLIEILRREFETDDVEYNLQKAINKKTKRPPVVVY
jgi:hypothetical protein